MCGGGGRIDEYHSVRRVVFYFIELRNMNFALFYIICVAVYAFIVYYLKIHFFPNTLPEAFIKKVSIVFVVMTWFLYGLYLHLNGVRFIHKFRHYFYFVSSAVLSLLALVLTQILNGQKVEMTGPGQLPGLLILFVFFLVGFYFSGDRGFARGIFALSSAAIAFLLPIIHLLRLTEHDSCDDEYQRRLVAEWERESEEREVLDNSLPASVRERFYRLENVYIQKPSGTAVLALAEFCEQHGIKDLADMYYDHLLSDYKWSREARAYAKRIKS